MSIRQQAGAIDGNVDDASETQSLSRLRPVRRAVKEMTEGGFAWGPRTRACSRKVVPSFGL